MKIAVFGATGQVGSQVVAEAVRRGHHVTALSRRATTAPDGATPVVGDAVDVSTVREVAASHDVVLSAVGPSRDPGGDPDAFVGVVQGLTEAVGGTRLIVVGGSGSLLAAPGVRLVDTPDFPDVFKAEALAQMQALEVLRAAGPDLDWTYVSPAPMVEAGERTGVYVSGLDEPVGLSITFADWAVALVDEIDEPAHRRQRFTVASA
jgi:putative NADH-flavin reductase